MNFSRCFVSRFFYIFFAVSHKIYKIYNRRIFSVVIDMLRFFLSIYYRVFSDKYLCVFADFLWCMFNPS